MTYQDMRKRLEGLERKIEEQGATEAVILSIDDGIDTRRLFMKRKTLYDLIYPAIQEEIEANDERRWPERPIEEEKALWCALAWAQCRSDPPDIVNRMLSVHGGKSDPILTISNCNDEITVPLYDEGIAKYVIQDRLRLHSPTMEKQQLESEEQEENEWER